MMQSDWNSNVNGSKTASFLLLNSRDERFCQPIIFKIAVRDQNLEEMQLPPHVVEYIKEVQVKTAILKGPVGNYWHVQMCQEAEGTFLREGWLEFRRANSIELHDQLIFRYIGNFFFDIEVLDGSGCEKIYRTNAGPLTLLASEETHREEHFNGSSREANKSGPLPTVQRPSEAAVEKAWMRSMSLNLTTPFFKCCLDKFNVEMFMLPINKAFAQKFFPANEKTSVVLRNSNGQAWTVEVAPTKGRRSFTRGLRKFVLDNKLKEGDVCVFELVENRDLQVHMFPLDAEEGETDIAGTS